MPVEGELCDHGLGARNRIIIIIIIIILSFSMSVASYGRVDPLLSIYLDRSILLNHVWSSVKSAGELQGQGFNVKRPILHETRTNVFIQAFNFRAKAVSCTASISH